MLRTSFDLAAQKRRGVILLVVIALLTLFAIVALSFVLYAYSAATSSRNFRDSESLVRPDLDPELLLSYFLGQLIYDIPDDERGIYSGLRGHSLARNMFGQFYRYDPQTRTFNYEVANGNSLNETPYSGTGRLHTASPLNPSDPKPGDFNNPYARDDYELINYTFFSTDGFLRDPERLGAWRISDDATTYEPWRTNPNDPTSVPGPYVGGFNAPYTYPDLNNLFLAVVKAGPLEVDGTRFPEGTLLMPSFHRPWLFRHEALGTLPVGAFDRQNPHWTSPEGKYLSLRPRPIDMGPGFPYPEDEGGDVKNLVGAPGYYDPYTKKIHNNDSIWIDLDFPVMTAPDGRQFKPLFAPLIVDLDNRINLNVHGNLHGFNNAEHASNQGWGPWEVNPAKVLDRNLLEFRNLFSGTRSMNGRYGPIGPPFFPHAANQLAEQLCVPRFYGPIDFDGSQEMANGLPSEQLILPDILYGPYQCFPSVPLGYASPNLPGSEILELTNHPKIYNPFTPFPPDRAFDLSCMEALLRYGDTGSSSFTSDVFHLFPQNFGDANDPGGSTKRRNLVTVRSFDVDRPGVSPYFWPSHLMAYNRYPPQTSALHPSGEAVNFPPLATALPFFDPRDCEFNPGDWRTTAALTGLRRIDLNRYLPDYPVPPSGGYYSPDQVKQFLIAQRARQIFAEEIFDCLVQVTGAGLPQPPDPLDPQRIRFNTWRYLAQLAVNIVDYIDSDDVMTPFNWFTEPATNIKHWVFGTELPRVLLNEAYVERGSFTASAWVELYNPFFTDSALFLDGKAKLDGAYALVITDKNSQLRDSANVWGAPDPQAIKRTLTNFGNLLLFPSDGATAGDNTRGYMVIGPGPLGTTMQPSLARPELIFPLGRGHSPTILLRRLACPYMPWKDNPSSPTYNPFITVDYMEDILVNHSGSDPTPRYAWGRYQPFAATINLPQTGIQLINHTFFSANSPRPTNYDWLVHLDRKLVSPMELMQVSAWKPHELTQQFITGINAEQKFNHRAPWFDEDLPPQTGRSHRLYRALEFLGTRNQTIGMMDVKLPGPEIMLDPMQPQQPIWVPLPVRTGTTSTGGTWRIEKGSSLVIDKFDPLNPPNREEVVRVLDVNQSGFLAVFQRDHLKSCVITPNTISERIPGKININTNWDEETFLALADPYSPQRSNNFTAREIHEIYLKLRKSRTLGTQISLPSGETTVISPETPGKVDRPFRSMATGLARDNQNPVFVPAGLEDTLLRLDPNDPDHRNRLLEIGNQEHPYLRMELMNKIFNNITNRSNVFAVWITVGFFEVTDDRVRPVKLGKEIGRAENRHVRHRMFAIVDRSVLTRNPGPQPRFNLHAPPPANTTTGHPVPYRSIID